MKIKTTIIGLGNIGLLYDYNSKNIQTHSKAIYLNKKFELIGAIEPIKNKRLLFYKKFKINTFSKLNDSIIKRSNLVVISTSTNLLFENLKKVINLNPKINILIEKPFGLKKKEIEFVIKKFKKNKIYINYYRNYNKNILDLKKIIFKKIKGPFDGSLYYCKGFLHNCSHYIALFYELFGKIKKVDINSVKSFKNNYYVNATVYYNNFRLSIYSNKKSMNNLFKINGVNGELNYQKDGSKISYKSNSFKTKKKNISNKILNYQKEVYNNIYKDLLDQKSNVFDYKKILQLNKEIEKFKLL